MQALGHAHSLSFFLALSLSTSSRPHGKDNCAHIYLQGCGRAEFVQQCVAPSVLVPCLECVECDVTLDRQSGEPREKLHRLPETYHGSEEWRRPRGHEIGSRRQKGKDTGDGNVCDMRRR